MCVPEQSYIPRASPAGATRSSPPTCIHTNLFISLQTGDDGLICHQQVPLRMQKQPVCLDCSSG